MLVGTCFVYQLKDNLGFQIVILIYLSKYFIRILFFRGMTRLLDIVLVINIYFQPIILSLSILTNTLSLCVLCSRRLRRSPCRCYFLAYVTLNLIYICLTCSTQFLRGFKIDWSKGRIGCKLHFYFLFLLPFQTNLMLVLASFDRYYSSSKIRQISSKYSHQTAKLTVLVSLIVSMVSMLPMLIIYNWNGREQICSIDSHLIVYIYSASQLIFHYFLAPFLMILFGCLTVSNIRRRTNHFRYIAIQSHHRLERQLTRTLFIQTIIHLTLILPFGFIYSLNIFKSSTRTEHFLAIRYILLMWQKLDYFISFFLFALSGRIYRKEFNRFIRKKLLRRRSN